jgi:hypothetical protein
MHRLYVKSIQHFTHVCTMISVVHACVHRLLIGWYKQQHVGIISYTITNVRGFFAAPQAPRLTSYISRTVLLK